MGSGKTIVAVLALMNAAFNGCQGAMMAPTEVLARQHYENITKMFEDYDIPIKVELLTGSMTAKEKRRHMTVSSADWRNHHRNTCADPGGRKL